MKEQRTSCSDMILCRVLASGVPTRSRLLIVAKTTKRGIPNNIGKNLLTYQNGTNHINIKLKCVVSTLELWYLVFPRILQRGCETTAEHTRSKSAQPPIRSP